MAEIRREYALQGLDESDAADDPIVQFQVWMENAIGANLVEPYAMTLATATTNGRPSARIVLLRGWDHRGFTFFSNYLSRKGRELEANGQAALTLFWAELERQVRIEGTVSRVDASESDKYFHARPLDSRLSASISAQSETVASRAELEERVAKLRGEYPAGDVPRPEHWGGYRLAPSSIEFWQGRPGRLHDRICYRRSKDAWRRVRLAP